MSRRWPSPVEVSTAARSLLRSGLVRLYRPDRLVRVGVGLTRYGLGPAAGPMAGAILHPDATGIVDETGSATMRRLDERCTAVAEGLAAAGFGPGEAVGVLARNSAAFYEAAVGASRLGLDVMYLNTGFAAEQVAAIVRERRVHGLVYDPEFADRIPGSIRAIPTMGPPHSDVDGGRPRSALARPGTDPGAESIATMAAIAHRTARVPGRPSRHVILTSGTTGLPKDVARTGGGLESVAALLSGLPFRVRETHLIAAPLFHAWGWLNMLLTMLLSSTVVVNQRFDAERALELVERERCDVLVAVPAMLRRIMDLPPDVRRRYDTSSLRVVAVSGSALSPGLARAFMNEFGEVLYSLYGSTEAAFATVAGPTDLLAAPGTAGRALPMVRVRVVDDEGKDAPRGQSGAILVSSRDATLPGVGGANGAVVRTGDVGWVDEEGRLFVASREDEMVIVGGENVYPILVESVLEEHPDLTEAAVIGAPDRVLGQILVAHVVARRGARVSAEAVREWCRGRLAYFQVPRHVVFHPELPRGETGKVLKRTLVKSHPTPEPDA